MNTALIIAIVLAALAFGAQLPCLCGAPVRSERSADQPPKTVLRMPGLVGVHWLLGVGLVAGRSVGLLRTTRRVCRATQ